MDRIQVVIDTNVIVSALRSRRGASYKLLLLLGSERFEINLSVPLVLEYEDAAKHLIGEIGLSEKDIDAIIDYICAVGRQREIYYLWRPVLGDPRDEMVLELAVAGNCQYVVTYNEDDFSGAEQFGIQVTRPRDFLSILGDIE